MKLPVDYDELTWQERREVREEYARLQDDKCFFCNENLNWTPAPSTRAMKINWDLFPGGEDFLKYPVHLQHNHETGMTEGAVHALCNAVMWQYYRR